jgi:hypothetical protein
VYTAIDQELVNFQQTLVEDAQFGLANRFLRYIFPAAAENGNIL